MHETTEDLLIKLHAATLQLELAANELAEITSHVIDAHFPPEATTDDTDDITVLEVITDPEMTNEIGF